jgi:hypothetical protein
MNKAVPRTFRSRLRVGGLVVALAVLGALIVGPSAMSGPDGKTYSAVFTSTAPGGENGQSMSLTIENLGTQQLGSADVTAPPGVLLQSVSGLNATSSFNATSITLRDLNLAAGAPVTFPMSANISCPARSASWSITGRQNNNGGGSVFTLAPPPTSNTVTQVTQDCTLSITVQPNHAEANTAITNTAYNDPAGLPVKVEARNNDNAVALAASADTVTLSKTAGFFTSGGTGFTGNALPLSSGGDVTFPNLKSDRTGLAFKLTATATGYNSSNQSNSFDIEVDGCKGAGCNPSTPAVGGNTHTQVSASGAGMAGGDSLGVGLLKYSQFTFPPGFCGAFEPIPGSDGFTTSVQVDFGSGGEIDYTITTILDKTVANEIPSNGVSAIPTCFFGNRIDLVTGLPRTCSLDLLTGFLGFPTVNDPNGNGSFRAKCDAGGTEAWGGLLPDVPNGTNACTDPLTDPAVLSKNRSGPGPDAAAHLLPWDGWGGH